MPINRLPLSNLIDAAEGDMNGIEGVDSRLRRSTTGVLARIVAGVAHGLYGFIAATMKNLFTRTMDRDHLIQEAADYGVPLKSATFARFPVLLTGSAGTAEAGQVLQRADGATFSTLADATLVDGAATVTVQADVAGAGSNTAVGSDLRFISPVSGIANVATVQAGGIAGSNEEAIESLRGRVQQRKRNPPGPGKRTDFERWALEVPGVTRAWAYELWMGPGTVGVAFVFDGRDDIIPTDDDVAAMQAYLDDRRGVCRHVYPFAPTPVARDYTITVMPATDAVKAAITASLKDLILREGEPAGTLLISHEREAISTADGEFDHVLTAPTGNITYAAGHIPVFGAITWGD